jgi:hypothetical protein
MRNYLTGKILSKRVKKNWHVERWEQEREWKINRHIPKHHNNIMFQLWDTMNEWMSCEWVSERDDDDVSRRQKWLKLMWISFQISALDTPQYNKYNSKVDSIFLLNGFDCWTINNLWSSPIKKIKISFIFKMELFKSHFLETFFFVFFIDSLLKFLFFSSTFYWIRFVTEYYNLIIIYVYIRIKLFKSGWLYLNELVVDCKRL